LVGRCAAFCLLRRFSPLTLGPSLIIQDHLLETAAPTARTLSPGSCASRTLSTTTLGSCAISTILGIARRAFSAGSAAWKSPAPKPAAGSVRARVGRRPRACGSLLGILRRSRRSLHALERGHLERYANRARGIAKIEFLRSVLKSKLAGFHSVVPERQSWQIETAVLVRPTDPGSPGRRFHQAKIRAGNRHTAGRSNDARGSRRGRRLGRRWLILRGQGKWR